MSNQHINIGVENAEQGFARFIGVWHKAESGDANATEMHLNFEDFSMLLAVLTPRRLELLKHLRQHGPLSVRALSKGLSRDYKNVYDDTRALQEAGLIERKADNTLQAPWDVIDAHVRLVA
jgi:predicted transcriptional regulator